MKRNAKKGFTLVELVIVIAVIAILAAVLIPTFGGIIEKANASSALQEAKNEWTEYLTDVDYATETAKENLVIVVKNKKYIVKVVNGKMDAEATKVELASNQTFDAYLADLAQDANAETTDLDALFGSVYLAKPAA